MKLAIIGGGPSGLRAAEIASEAGVQVTLYERKPSVGRKFLVAGHGGLNLTHSEEFSQFIKRYQGSFSDSFWTSLLADFSNEQLRQWAHGLGIETFIGTSGRVFPKEFKAAPLLRAWVKRLRNRKISWKTRHFLSDIRTSEGLFRLTFATPNGTSIATHEAVILALGGASWPATGSDASWISLLSRMSLEVNPLESANCGWDIKWNPDILPQIEGAPLKNLTVSAGGTFVQGELMITKDGLEGGAIYQLGSILRSMENPSIELDLKPTFSIEELARKLPVSRKDNMLSAASRAWKLTPTAALLLEEFTPVEAREDTLLLAGSAKRLILPLARPRPIAEAISSAGGVSFRELDGFLMVKRFPGLFLAGEMLDWEAPTGGYLLQGCFSTGTRAAQGTLAYLSRKSSG